MQGDRGAAAGPGGRWPARGTAAGPFDGHEREIPLLGGTANRGQVVRVGATVRRPRPTTSPATYALLRHLAAVGFDGAPRPLGVDSRGREVLSYVPGTAVTPPYPAWALTDEALASVAEILRSYHDAVSTFDPTPYAWPPSPPEPFAGELVSHNDPNLDNVVFRSGRAAALIDFDLASPGSRIWDIACAARLWVPLRPETYIDDARRGRVLHRFRLFVDSYGVADADRPAIVTAVARNHDWFRDLIQRHAADGHPAFAEYWNAGMKERAGHCARWYLEIECLLHAALR